MTEIEYLKKYLPPEKDLEQAIKRYENGEPIQYIIGDVEFYKTIIKVNKNVLIPRPETEELVEKIIPLIKKHFKSSKLNVLDIGTGSGCIAIALQKELKELNIDAIDISSKALALAQTNAHDNYVQINFFKSNLFSKVKNKYDIIISNPPYIKKDEPIMDIVKNNEPHIALYAKDNGLYFYKKILQKAVKYLNNKFIIAFEIGETQGQEVLLLAQKAFPNATILLQQDFHHLDRYIFIINE